MRVRATTIALLAIAIASVATACSVPVFRYAIEHWQPDSYIAYIFHDGELTAEQQDLIESLESKGANGIATINLVVRTVGSDEKVGPVIQKIQEEHPASVSPWIVVQTPPKVGPPQTVWQGELTEENVAVVRDSPLRSEINKRLLAGDSVVWVFLESGRSEADDPAFALLSKEIERLQGTLKLPEIEEEDLVDLSVDPTALKVSFSAVRLSRDDLEEQPLVEMLLHVEPDLKDIEYISQPMVFPVFGRGRALYAIIGEGITPEVIEAAGQFLTGACQCTVKAQNPGVDLIMNLDWNKHVIPTETIDSELPPLAGFSGFVVEEDEVEMATVGVSTDVSIEGVKASNASLTEEHEASNLKGDRSEPSESKRSETVSKSNMGTNVLFVLFFLVVGVALASVLIAPRT
ncbi:MAG: hypothetical protein HON04_18305 [Planctomicrobium sp.]|jgi:hypothetical protein|nr:hypothetical protein [Planctomicrobium sp.]